MLPSKVLLDGNKTNVIYNLLKNWLWCVDNVACSIAARIKNYTNRNKKEIKESRVKVGWKVRVCDRSLTIKDSFGMVVPKYKVHELENMRVMKNWR